MAEVLDWQRVADPQAVVLYAVQSLRQGRTVAFATETGYAVTASGLIPEAVRRLSVDAGKGEPLTLALHSAAEARDWVPALSSLGRRLARRLWPGPVTLLVGGDVERGLLSRLPEEVTARVCIQSMLSLTTPRQEALREVLRHLPGPLIMAAANEASADVVVEDGPRSPAAPATLIAVNGDSWQIVRPGIVSEEQVLRQTACVVLFVCTGNTCRSPLAEALFKKRLADRLGCAIEELPGRGYQVMSAGLSAAGGRPAAAEAEQVARGYGADLSAHRSQPLTLELAAQADLLVGMTQSHLRALTDYFGHLGASPRLLDPAGDIADPIGGDQPVYDECGQQIWELLESLAAEITGNV
ncbi:MAG TPA: Sua5/YciO/YrdC/YwlC family protein [Gemmataceae bacterium]|nr:Sua5/YciO/YrdC/YwlC family protein [Gemmataceae bacterium]